jgi:hypothetical protein
MVMDVQVLQMAGNFLTSQGTVNFSRINLLHGTSQLVLELSTFSHDLDMYNFLIFPNVKIFLTESYFGSLKDIQINVAVVLKRLCENGFRHGRMLERE